MTERRHSGGVTACTLMQLHDCFYTSSGTSRAGCRRHPKAHPWTQHRPREGARDHVDFLPERDTLPPGPTRPGTAPSWRN